MTFRHRLGALLLASAIAGAGFSTDIARGASASPSSEPIVELPTAAALEDGTYTCTPAHAALLDARRQQIADAPTVDDARELAVGPVRVARRALTVASVVAPGSDSLADARERLETFESDVERSSSPGEVATRFTELVDPSTATAGAPIVLADLQVGDADVEGPGNCAYSTGEIIAVIIGFILFIIPGIILLIVLC